MSKKTIALLGEYENIDKILQQINNGQISEKDLTIISIGFDEVLFDKLPDNVKFAEFYDYTPRDYEEITLKKFGRIADKWFQANSFQKHLIINGLNISDSSRQYFCTKVLQRKIHFLLTVQAVLESESPDLIYTDAQFAPYLSTLNQTSFRYIGKRAKKRSFTALTFFYRSFFSVLYKIFCKTLFAKIIGFLKHKKIASINTVILGTDHMMRNFTSFIEAASRDNKIHIFKPVNLEILKNYNIFRHYGNRNIVYFEGLLKIKEFTKVLVHVVKSLCRFYRVWEKGGFRDAFVVDGLDIYGIVEEDFLKFVILNMPEAIKCAYLTSNIIEKYRPSKVFFAYENWWGFSVMNKVLQNAKVVTLSYNHGIILEIIPHRSSVDIMLCSGEYDRAMLERFSSSKEYVNFGRISDNIPKFENNVSSGRNILLLSTPVPDKYELTGGFSRDFIRKHFIQETLSFINQQSARLDFDSIVIKLHPLGNVSRIKTILKKYPNLEQKVCVTKSDLYRHIANAKVIFSLMSTVVLDCISYDKPFFICDFPFFLYRGISFYNAIDDIVKYRDAGELSQKYEKRINQVGLNEKLRTLYYGPRNIDSLRVLETYVL